MFDSILGNEAAKAYLTKAFHGDQFPHALLFTGLDGIGKSLFAKALSLHFLKTTPNRIANETHPDFHPIRPEGKSGVHTIETLRNLIDQVYAAPFEAPAKCFIIYDAERMQPAAANALLKTLEEPAPNTYLILLASSMQNILPTIQSRCGILKFHPLSSGQIASLLKERGFSEHFADLSQGSIGRALELAQKEPIEEVLFPLLAQKRPYFELSKALEKIEKMLEAEDPVKQNSNVDHFFASILMWYRDQHLRDYRKSGFFFPEAPQSSHPIASLEKISKLIDEARLAYQRNMKLSTCLEAVFY